MKSYDLLGFLLLLSATINIAASYPPLNPGSEKDAIVNPPGPQPDVVTSTKPDNDTTTAIPITSTTTTSTTPPTTTTTTTSTTQKPTTTGKPTTSKPAPITKPPTPAPTSPSPSTEPTSAPRPATTSSPPMPPPPSKGRHFDGLSFMGGIILTACIVGLSVASYKFYKIKTDRSYRTL